MASDSDSKQETQYDKIGPAYLEAQNKFYLPRNDWARDWVRNVRLKPGSIILDIGCGDGSDLLYWKAQGHQVIGVDQSKFMLSKAKESGLQNTELLHLDIDSQRLKRTYPERVD